MSNELKSLSEASALTSQVVQDHSTSPATLRGKGATMETVTHLIRRVTVIMHYISCAILVAMMFVTLADVTTRALFSLTDGQINLTFFGGVELIKYGLLLMVLYTLPYALERSQVVVDIFTGSMSKRMTGWLEGLYQWGFMLLGLGITVRLLALLEEANLSGERTQELFIPMSTIYTLSVTGSAILTIVAGFNGIRHFIVPAHDPAAASQPKEDIPKQPEADS